MKITLFTSNSFRHNYLINLLSNASNELWVIQECRPFFSKKKDMTANSSIIEKYFQNVRKAEDLIFKKEPVNKYFQNIKTLSILYGELNNLELGVISDFLKSDIYVIFGSSFIKGDLINFLISQKAINIHAGVSPYYRGCDCNFWALYDDNPHLVGSTIHLLSKGLDSGPILYHAMSSLKESPFLYTMSTIKSAFYSISEKIKNGSIFKIIPKEQEKLYQIRYSKKSEFNKNIVRNYFQKKINLNSKKINISQLKEPYFLK